MEKVVVINYKDPLVEFKVTQKFSKTDFYCLKCGKKEVWKETFSNEMKNSCICTNCSASFSIPLVKSSYVKDEVIKALTKP